MEYLNLPYLNPPRSVRPKIPHRNAMLPEKLEIREVTIDGIAHSMQSHTRSGHLSVATMISNHKDYRWQGVGVKKTKL